MNKCENKNCKCKNKENCDCEKRGCTGCYYNKEEKKQK